MDLRQDSGEREATAVDHALDQLSTALDHLVKAVEDGGLDLYDDERLVAFLRSYERVRNRTSLVDHRAIADSERRGLPDALTQPTMKRVLVQLLRLSPAVAARRVRAAEACGDRSGPTGESLAPRRPRLAAAQRDGEVSPEQVHVIEHALSQVDRPGFDPVAVAEGEALLTRFAGTFGPKDLQLLAQQTVDAIDPDGSLPDEQLCSDRRHLQLRPCRDGMYGGELRLTGALGAKLTALLSPLARPRLDPVPTPDGTAARALDERTLGQRTHDALEEICDRVLRAGDVVGTGGVPATVIVTISSDDLLDRLGHGTTTDGTRIPTREVLRMARAAEILPAVLTSSGAVLELGRTRRIASPTQTYALVARDHGCSFPGCDRAPEWCERHHVVEWVDGGTTDLDNLTLLCRYHHRHFAGGGWSCRINDEGLPEWRPPRWLDRAQRPMVNQRILSQLSGWQRGSDRRRSRAPAVSQGSEDP